MYPSTIPKFYMPSTIKISNGTCKFLCFWADCHKSEDSADFVCTFLGQK